MIMNHHYKVIVSWRYEDTIKDFSYGSIVKYFDNFSTAFEYAKNNEDDSHSVTLFTNDPVYLDYLDKTSENFNLIYK